MFVFFFLVAFAFVRFFLFQIKASEIQSLINWRKIQRSPKCFAIATWNYCDFFAVGGFGLELISIDEISALGMIAAASKM